MLKSLVKLASKPSAALAVSKTCTIASVKLAPASLHWLRSVHAPVTVRSFSTTPKPDPAPTKAAPGSENSDSDFKDEPRNPKYDPARASSIQSRGMRIFFAFVAALGIGGYAYLDYLERQKGPAKVTSYQTAGEIKLGGPWSNLVDSEGKPASSDQYLGKYMLIYFGFTHCPDICPTEINKMMAALDKIQATNPEIYDHIKTVFITVDPARDTQQRLREYAKQYHSRLRWITGRMDDIVAAAKKYRVYFSIPDDLAPGEDYLVDHSIFFYMMGRDGKFMEFFGKNLTADEIAVKMTRIVKEDLASRPRV